MRKIIILIGLIAAINLYCQNLINPPNLFIIQNDSLHLDTGSVNSGTLNKFLLGYNWGSPGARLDSALLINTYHDYNLASTDYADSMNVIQSFHTILCSRQDNKPFTALSLYLNPSIVVDTSQNFIPKPYDNTGAVFGFKTKNKVRIMDSSQHSNANYPFVHLDKDSVPYGTSTLVLSNIWKKDALHFLDYFDRNFQKDKSLI